jgi:hypothetical protein
MNGNSGQNFTASNFFFYCCNFAYFIIGAQKKMTFGFCRRLRKNPLIFPIKVNSGKKCHYIWHMLSQLEVGFITDFHSWRNCEFQMFCVFLSAVFTPLRNEPANLRQLWHSLHHLCGMMVDAKKPFLRSYTIVVLIPTYKKTKLSKFLIWRKNSHFPHYAACLRDLARHFKTAFETVVTCFGYPKTSCFYEPIDTVSTG